MPQTGAMKDYAWLKQIAKELFSEDEIKDVRRLDGLTNHTYAVTLNCGKYVFRLPGDGTEELINRHDEKISTELASQVGVDVPLIYFNAQTGVKVAEYIDGETMSPESMKENRNVRGAAQLFGKIHNCGKDTHIPFEVFDMAKGYEKIISDNGVSFYDDYAEIRATVMAIKEKIDNINVRKVPCHNDPLCENWLRCGERMYLIDWEYAGMNDPMWDLADLSIEAWYDDALDSELLSAYFGRKPDANEILRFNANKIFLDFLWSLWGKTRVPFDGEEMEKYAYDRYVRMKQNLHALFGSGVK
ncbi:MAG: phosphotransferase family protein [Clostridiales bacterium]|jgi:thiamine kinase-like enzyme|nr:phosphotransferase family protein [Clostridiales bacterium]HOB37353.1 choline/ethanolamine kinase family protein [Candidatus Avimonas sp.]HQD38825.1 choline/ethanolamine kinase family protein [Candidatus Avimonas sp.]